MRQEFLFQVEEESEGDAASELAGRDDEVGERGIAGEIGVCGGRGGGAAGGSVGYVVHEETVVGVGQLLGRGVRDFGEDDAGERGGVG